MKLLTFKDKIIPMSKKLFVVLLIVINTFPVFAQVLPPAPELVKVSVNIETGKPQVYWYWDTSDDSLVDHFEVWRSRYFENNQVQWYHSDPIKDINDTLWEDTRLDKYEHSLGYTIKACRPDSTASIVKQIDSTIFLSGEFDSCQASIYLYWNEYNSWRGEVEYYGVYVSQNNGPWQLDQQVSDGSTSAVISNVDENVGYRIFIAAIRENERRDSSSSNLIKVKTTMTELPDYLFGDNATYSSGGQQVNFSVDTSGFLKKYYLLKSKDANGLFDTIKFFSNTTQFSYYDGDNFLNGPYYYKMSGVNFCNTTMLVSENIVSTVVLAGNLSDEQVTLNWNNYETYNGQDILYNLERKYGDGEYAEIVETSNTSYTDYPKQVADASGFSSRVFYRVWAIPELSDIYKYGNSGISMSNEISLELPSAIRFEYDAFIPGGDINGNESFGPAMDMLPESFWFRIFDANGYMVFESKDANNSNWDGKINGHYAQEGVYAYVLVYSGGNGGENIIKGNVTVAYP